MATYTGDKKSKKRLNKSNPMVLPASASMSAVAASYPIDPATYNYGAALATLDEVFSAQGLGKLSEKERRWAEKELQKEVQRRALQVSYYPSYPEVSTSVPLSEPAETTSRSVDFSPVLPPESPYANYYQYYGNYYTSPTPQRPDSSLVQQQPAETLEQQQQRAWAEYYAQQQKQQQSPQAQHYSYGNYQTQPNYNVVSGTTSYSPQTSGVAPTISVATQPAAVPNPTPSHDAWHSQSVILSNRPTANYQSNSYSSTPVTPAPASPAATPVTTAPVVTPTVATPPLIPSAAPTAALEHEDEPNWLASSQSTKKPIPTITLTSAPVTSEPPAPAPQQVAPASIVGQPTPPPNTLVSSDQPQEGQGYYLTAEEFEKARDSYESAAARVALEWMKRSKEVEAELDELRMAFENATKDLAVLGETNRKLQEERSALKIMNVSLQNRSNHLRTDMQELAKKQLEAEQERDRLRSEFEELKKKQEIAITAVEANRFRQEESEQKDRQVQELQRKLAELEEKHRGEVQELSTRFEREEAEKMTLQNETKGLREELESLRETLKTRDLSLIETQRLLGETRKTLIDTQQNLDETKAALAAAQEAPPAPAQPATTEAAPQPATNANAPAVPPTPPATGKRASIFIPPPPPPPRQRPSITLSAPVTPAPASGAAPGTAPTGADSLSLQHLLKLGTSSLRHATPTTATPQSPAEDDLLGVLTQAVLNRRKAIKDIHQPGGSGSDIDDSNSEWEE